MEERSAHAVRGYYFLLQVHVEPWAKKEAGGTLIELNFQEGEILTLSKWDKFYVISALLSAMSLMACLVSASEFSIFHPLLEVDYVGVRFSHVSSRFHLFWRHKIDGVFRLSHKAVQPSANGSMRYMMWIPCNSSFISLWNALCLANLGWYMSRGILLCVVFDVLSAMDLCHVWAPFMPHWRDALISYVYFEIPCLPGLAGYSYLLHVSYGHTDRSLSLCMRVLQ